MKACIVVGTYFSPGQTFVNRHIEKLFGGDTCVISDSLNDLRDTDDRFMGWHSVPVSGVTKPFQRLTNHLRHGSSRMPHGAADRAVRKFLREQAPDVILAEFGPQGVAIAPIANKLGIPVFCYFRGSDASSRIRHDHVQRAYQRMMPRLEGIFAVSQFLLDNLARRDIRHPNAVVIPSGVDVRRFVPGDKTPLSCLGVGRFVEKKAPLLTIRAFAEATQNLDDAHLTMIGDGDLLESARSLVSELGIAHKVSLPGALPHEDVRQHLERTEFYIQHSVTANNGNTEGLPTAIQEAMSAGCITVSTRHAGIPEAVEEGRSGFLVDELDEVAFTNAIRDAVKLPEEKRREMAAYARAVALEKFDNAKLLTQLEQALATAVNR
ncbi:glycosyltransferase [Primorskyibacter flagellatus]|uniref:Glycosyltransferase involved in cell wall bisynthesis n=1 Tax=Primorskyibacter flagellatus TaxID=1387277 RepID=A0A1W1ZCY0_9RHOB|nr:glycosyltransferase [Primorskyibacter flagellatus]SMC46244.1 Glycosyltransferase involved in cell wall bisynthesis [Primorskyibacter flagellatus]